jgi:5-methylcytosine-specific restriction endonuclease McrA
MSVLAYVREGGSIRDLDLEHRARRGDLIVEWSDGPIVGKCSRCSATLAARNFGRHPRAASGLQPACRSCDNTRRRERYATEPDYRTRAIKREEAKRRAAGTTARVTLTPQQRSARRRDSCRAWQRDNPEKARAATKQWCEANPDRVRAHKRADYRRNREQYVERAARRTQALRAADRRVILDRELRRLYASPCSSCGTHDRIEADHVISIHRGGRHSIGNLQPLCRACNASKGTKLLIEWKRTR